jgi:superfamily II DNA or RNA helicase
MLPSPGSVVWIRQHRWTVERLDRREDATRLDVVGRDCRTTFVAPFDRPIAASAARRPRRVRRQAARARLLMLLAETGSHRSIVSAADAQVDLLPYQLEPALAIVSGARRVLIADEVGLGKTVQAGFAIAELQRRVPTMRALVLVPAAVRDQWMGELRERFGLTACPIQADVLRREAGTGRADDNPWRRRGLWLASTDFLKQPHVLDGLPPMRFDLLVIDEAHDVGGDSVRHDACRLLARRSRCVLLLTATPHSGDDRRFRRLATLGAIDLENDRLIVFRRRRADVAPGPGRRVRWHMVRPHDAERRLHDAFARFERAVLAARSADGSKSSGGRLLLSVFLKRALSTPTALARSIERRLAWLEASPDRRDEQWTQLGLAFEPPDTISADDAAALCGDSGLRPAAETLLLRRLLTVARSAIPHAAKLSRVRQLLARRGEPIIVFTEFRDSLDAIVGSLTAADRVATLHGGQSEEVRRGELNRFLIGAASVLIATDVASQGLNLQKASRWIVSFELPWNPARLEQRIGRVDRIGQTRAVHATLLVTRHSSEDRVLRNLARRTLAARACSGSETLPDLLPPAEPHVTAALLDDQPLPDLIAAPEVLQSTTAWQRPGRSVARATASRRACRQKRPGHGPPPHRMVRARDARLLSLIGGTRTLALVTVAVMTSGGSMLERHAFALSGPAHLLDAPALTPDVLRQVIGARLAPRLRRLQRWRDADAVRAMTLERALDVVDHRSRETQFGLFDGRAARQVAVDDRLLRLERYDSDRHLERTGGTVEMATPVVQILWTAR